MLLMPLRRTPGLPLWRGLRRPSCSDIRASSAAGAAAGGLGLLLAGVCGFAALQIVFCQLPHFPADFFGSVAPLAEADWWLSPLPIIRALPSVSRFDSLTGELRVRAQGRGVAGAFWLPHSILCCRRQARAVLYLLLLPPPIDLALLAVVCRAHVCRGVRARVRVFG
jgi:hypothetical protein